MIESPNAVWFTLLSASSTPRILATRRERACAAWGFCRVITAARNAAVTSSYSGISASQEGSEDDDDDDDDDDESDNKDDDDDDMVAEVAADKELELSDETTLSSVPEELDVSKVFVVNKSTEESLLESQNLANKAATILLFFKEIFN
jgi:hypothetical protein